jgi:putative tryptophan/tyrosine transport system substrate-binding protein
VLERSSCRLARARTLIVAHTTPAVTALRQDTGSVPIVFVAVADPMGLGLVTSLAHPGGNITGFTNFESSMGGKWLQLLKEMAPRVGRVAMIFNPESAPGRGAFFSPTFETASQALSIKPVTLAVHSAGALEAAIATFAQERDGGLVVTPDTFTSFHKELIVSLAARHRLPAIYPFRFFASQGGLISYGSDPVDPFQRASLYVDRILKGERPANLPVQAPTKFELVINLKTAKTLGLEVAPFLLAQADEAIE